jgi:hypothetical protein
MRGKAADPESDSRMLFPMGLGEPYGGGKSGERRSTVLAEWAVIISAVIIVLTFWLTLGHQSIQDIRGWNTDVTQFGQKISAGGYSDLCIALLTMLVFLAIRIRKMRSPGAQLLNLLASLLTFGFSWLTWNITILGVVTPGQAHFLDLLLLVLFWSATTWRRYGSARRY